MHRHQEAIAILTVSAAEALQHLQLLSATARNAWELYEQTPEADALANSRRIMWETAKISHLRAWDRSVSLDRSIELLKGDE